MSSASLYQRFRDWLPKGVYRPAKGGGLWLLLKTWTREVSGQCPNDTGQTCAEKLDSYYQGPGCRNKSCPKYAGKEGMAQVAEQSAAQVQLLASEGDYLDLWASFFNLRRRAEEDEVFRFRVIQEAFATKVTKAALLKALRPFYPGNESKIQIIEYEFPNTARWAGFTFDDPAGFTGDQLVDNNGPGGTARYRNPLRRLAVYGARGDGSDVEQDAALDAGYVTDGRFDGFNAQLGLWPYQFRIIVPAIDRFVSAFVFTHESVQQAKASTAAYAKDAYDASGENDVIDDTVGFRRANASREIQDMIRRIKAAGTQPIFMPENQPSAVVRGKM